MKFRKILLTLLLLFIPSAIITVCMNGGIAFGGIPTFLLYGIFFYFIKRIWCANTDVSPSQLPVDEVKIYDSIGGDLSFQDDDLAKHNSGSGNHANTHRNGIFVLSVFNIILVLLVIVTLLYNLKLKETLFSLSTKIDVLSEQINSQSQELTDTDTRIDALNERVSDNYNRLNEIEPNYGKSDSAREYEEKYIEWREKNK